MLVAAAVCFSAAAVVAQDTEGDQKKIQGTWAVVSAEKGGKKAPAKEIEGITFTFTGDKLSLKKGGESKDGKFKLDATRKPREIDVTMEDRTARGIYQLDKDALKICVGKEGDERPKEFAAPEGSRFVIIVFKREKP
jgi:uncharacterized protein (TIGR03067 family)